MSSLVCSCVGLEWTVVSDKTNTGQCDTKFLQLFIHLCAIEIHVILNNSITEKNNEFLSACYSVIEIAIFYFAKTSDEM